MINCTDCSEPVPDPGDRSYGRGDNVYCPTCEINNYEEIDEARFDRALEQAEKYGDLLRDLAGIPYDPLGEKTLFIHFIESAREVLKEFHDV